MEDFYRKMMNHGFLISEVKSKYFLAKIETESDHRTVHHIYEAYPDLFEKPFDTYETAIETVKKLIGWKEPELAVVQRLDTSWKLEMMYRHKGLGTKFAELGELGASSYDTAVAEANKRAESYIAKSGLEDYVERFEVKVRPCQTRN